jgi:hypothetical protein
VLVIWEPILRTDWSAPRRGTLARISDRRARQFWDPNHLVSVQLSRNRVAKAGQQGPDCCEDQGFFWDDAILYGPHAHWKDMPVAVFWNGPVWKIIPQLEKAAPDTP